MPAPKLAAQVVENFSRQIFEYLDYEGRFQAQMLNGRLYKVSACWQHTTGRRIFQGLRCEGYGASFALPPGFALLEFPSRELLGSLTSREKKTMQLRDLVCSGGARPFASLTKSMLEFAGDDGVMPNISLQVMVVALPRTLAAGSHEFESYFSRMVSRKRIGRAKNNHLYRGERCIGFKALTRPNDERLYAFSLLICRDFN
jgi:hypothetical protein